MDESKFKKLIVPHFDTAYSLARWLTRNDADAADVIQDSCLKAFRFLAKMSSDSPRAWFLQIVRNTSYTLLKNKKQYVEMASESDVADLQPDAETILGQNASAKILREALDELTVEYKEILVLRELEELSYDEISEVIQIPHGTVMSRLARARAQLKKILISKGALS